MLPLNVVLATVLRYIGVRRKGRYRECFSQLFQQESARVEPRVVTIDDPKPPGCHFFPF